jgi:hypothetical protein
LIGSYGSKFDLDLFEFATEPEEALKHADPVCDECIASLRNNGFIRFVRAMSFNDLELLSQSFQLVRRI